MSSGITKEEEQRRRAVLRERYLIFLQKAAHKSAIIGTCENTKLTATIKSFQLSSEHVIVENLATPIGNIPKAVLRSTDIVKIQIDPKQTTTN
ncbi:hypothetical protein CAEBREN_23945 [Caenorhabditis brenneri]|uniref:Gem-associated protein 7 n=1 Tax=Caenorhabditis brenneri TaxID=135651 RepID=G0MLD7_CAEBE|nr:hypothetical protein CAEBREN_23945 [Caenorhabditis brenneri]